MVLNQSVLWSLLVSFNNFILIYECKLSNLATLFLGPIFNGECIDASNDLAKDERIFMHQSYYPYDENSHVQDCSNFCLTHNPHNFLTDNKIYDEVSQNNITVEETTVKFKHTVWL